MSVDIETEHPDFPIYTVEKSRVYGVKITTYSNGMMPIAGLQINPDHPVLRIDFYDASVLVFLVKQSKINTYFSLLDTGNDMDPTWMFKPNLSLFRLNGYWRSNGSLEIYSKEPDAFVVGSFVIDRFKIDSIEHRTAEPFPHVMIKFKNGHDIRFNPNEFRFDMNSIYQDYVRCLWMTPAHSFLREIISFLPYTAHLK